MHQRDVIFGALGYDASDDEAAVEVERLRRSAASRRAMAERANAGAAARLRALADADEARAAEVNAALAAEATT
jgi:hypothetical protein